ncbi:MAG: DUF2165 family protein [Paenirhodobacter sp.]|uniref:DUF2165 family protein n=1 Tax=Paenirhodobacter sp. TaxID=1965326 RepID=UPI003D13933F
MIRLLTSPCAPKAVLMTGLAVWMTVAALNNATDPATNMTHLRTMLSMDQLIADPVFGNGLEWRSWGGFPIGVLLAAIITWQAATALALWVAAVTMIRAAGTAALAPRATRRATLALTMFMAMWLVFLSGGLWFGYWMKQGPIQGVHFTMLGVALLSLLFINQSAGDRGTAA